ncbi:hemicentin-2-like [Limulus polyphemus]|uniref:Hemicentin-2-like n=1 Tax=Limulus polyphemus TaxID=6850 RepID=A0ABM1SLS6_LIMPO|nr:hemicentin-2-like [Limulus polyphemus]
MLYLVSITVMCFFTSEVQAFEVKYFGKKIVQEGYPFSLECEISEFDIPKWTKDGVVIVPSEQNNYTLSHKELRNHQIRLRLSVDFAQLHHEGEYRCNSFSRESHRLYIVSVDYQRIKEIEETTKKKDFVQNIVLQIGKTFQLQCNLDDVAVFQVSWYKNGHRIVPEKGSNMVLKDDKLIVNEAEEADAGEYSCTVDPSSLSRPVAIGQHIQVRSPVRVEKFPETISVVLQRNLTLECHVHGYPIPTVFWFIGNEPVEEVQKNNSRLVLFSNEDGLPGAILFLRNVTFNDRNLYTCVAQNVVNSYEASVFVSIRATMIHTNEEVPGQGIILKPPQPLYLVCNTTDDLSLSVVWYKDGLPLNGNERIKIFSENNSVIVKMTTESDTGEYTCAVTKPNINSTILVRTHTEFYEHFPNSLNLVQGDKLVLTCKVKGAPIPIVTWLKDEMPLNTSDPRIKLENSDRGVPDAKLVIENLDYDDRAYYTCEANNGVNNVTNTVLVRVKDKLAALWPFLGICAEVAVLCAIIFIYEKKRVKQDFDESDTDQNVDKL